ncbi:conserved hypothetical protein [Limnobacter sp. 130]|uniref:hypothetical protein n=1 Tax=Limnobacter sp. 130 TaxID=2653147 RepID=UPI0012F054D2|nr:hypothetical protein [Limnobacter sp. 130]VWX36519.1 conserved hypothetical protein [Limnobacter sp. 130]
MSLSDLPNPKAAAELIAKYRRRFSSKVCMAPNLDHHGPVVAAHTLSVEAMLRKVATDSHVYVVAQAKRFAKDTFPIEIHRKGLRDVTVFNGFCQKHDRDLFACLELEPFRFQRQQCFMLAYRAVARECYLKRKQFESIPTPDEVASVHGVEQKIQFSGAMLMFQAASLKGAEDVERLKSAFDKHLLAQSWDRLVTRAILFPSTPTVLAAAAFQPFIDMDGNQLQDFEDLESETSQICISVIPTETGGAAIFSWLDSANSAPQRYFDSVVRSQDLTASVLHVIFDNTENFAINPSWYEGMTESEKSYVFSRVVLFAQNTTYADSPRPDQTAPKLASWGEGVVAAF